MRKIHFVFLWGSRLQMGIVKNGRPRLIILTSLICCLGMGLLLVLIHTSGCFKKQADQTMALKDALDNLVYARDFKKLFPNSIQYFSYFTGEYGPPTLNSKAGLYGRYILTMQIKVTLDSTRTKITDYEKPTFYLIEVNNISVSTNGGAEISYLGLQRQIGQEEWMKVVEHNGDVSCLGVELTKDKPVQGFEEHWPDG